MANIFKFKRTTAQTNLFNAANELNDIAAKVKQQEVLLWDALIKKTRETQSIFNLTVLKDKSCFYHSFEDGIIKSISSTAFNPQATGVTRNEFSIWLPATLKDLKSLINKKQIFKSIIDNEGFFEKDANYVILFKIHPSSKVSDFPEKAKGVIIIKL